jgi:hypothetical protein
MTTKKRSAGTNDLHDEIDVLRDKISQLISQERERTPAGIMACALIQAAIDFAILMPVNEEPCVQSLKWFVSEIVDAYIKRTVEMPRSN